MLEQSSGLAEEGDPKIIVQFCGSRCWKRSECGELAATQAQRGSETVAELFRESGEPERKENRIELVLLNRLVVLQKMSGCIGACGKDPAAKVMPQGNASDGQYFKADSVEAVLGAIAQVASGDDLKK